MDTNIESELQAIYNAVDAPEVDATEETDNAADIAAPDSEVASETTELDTTESETVDDESTESEEVIETDDSNFQDLLDEIPSNDQILKTHTRIANSAKEDLVRFADGWRNTKATLDTIGGEKGAEILQPLAQILLSPDVGSNDTFEAWSSIVATNPVAAHQMLFDGAANLLFTKENTPMAREMSKYGDAVLEQRFGDGVNADKIDKLLMLEKGGYINLDEDLQLLQAEGTDSSLFQQQQTILEEQQRKIQELTDLVNNPEKITQQTVASTNAMKDFEAELQQRINTGITPFRERGRWGEESALTKTVMRGLVAELKESGEYKEALSFVRQYGSIKQGDIIPFPLEQKLYTLVNKAKGKFSAEVMAINKELRALAETSQNAKVKEEVKEVTKPKAVPVAPSRTFSNNPFGLPELEAIYAESDRARV